MSILSIAIGLLVVYFGGVITGALLVIFMIFWLLPPALDEAIAAETPRDG